MSSGFRAPPWAWVLTAAAVALFAALGTWQARKGLTKVAMLDALGDRSAPAEILSAASAAPQGLGLRRAEATGTYLAGQQLLQDGHSHRQRPGYQVWTPLQLRDGALVLVNRGWVPRAAAAAALPAPDGEIAVRGFWRALPEPGLRLEGANPCPAEKKFPVIVLYPTVAEVQCLLGRAMLAGLLLLDADLAGGFVREWTDFGFPPQRHYGYAFQWFALAAAAVILFALVNRKRPAPDTSTRGQA